MHPTAATMPRDNRLPLACGHLLTTPRVFRRSYASGGSRWEGGRSSIGGPGWLPIGAWVVGRPRSRGRPRPGIDPRPLARVSWLGREPPWASGECPTLIPPSRSLDQVQQERDGRELVAADRPDRVDLSGPLVDRFRPVRDGGRWSDGLEHEVASRGTPHAPRSSVSLERVRILERLSVVLEGGQVDRDGRVAGDPWLPCVQRRPTVGPSSSSSWGSAAWRGRVGGLGPVVLSRQTLGGRAWRRGFEVGQLSGVASSWRRGVEPIRGTLRAWCLTDKEGVLPVMAGRTSEP